MSVSSVIPVQTRDERLKSTNPDDFGDVTQRDIAWSLSPIARLQGLLSAELSGGHGNYSVSATGPVSTSWASMSDPVVGRAGAPEDRPGARAWNATQDAFVISIGADDVSTVSLSREVHDSQPVSAHIVIDVAPFAKTTIVLNNTGDANILENVEIVAGESSSISVVSLQEWSATAQHVATHFIRAEKAAEVKHVVVTLGGDVVRLNTQAHLVGSGSNVELLGLYFADSHQHLEHQVFVNHVADHTTSRVTYKGALQGEGARSVWIGDVLIGSDAVGTDSYEQNRNLILSEGARADSIPNLEIKTGDIAGAGHASATGRFDDDQLFYLKARGIPEAEARQLVVRGFLNEVVQRIGIAEVEARVEVALDNELEVVNVHG